MSAVPPIATELVTRGGPSLGANSRPEQVQQIEQALLDHLVDNGKKSGREGKAECLGSLEVHDQLEFGRL